jgi:hypothetical protein
MPKIQKKMIQMLKPTMIGAISSIVPVSFLRRGRGCKRFQCEPLVKTWVIGERVFEDVATYQLLAALEAMNKSGIVSRAQRQQNRRQNVQEEPTNHIQIIGVSSIFIAVSCAFIPAVQM